jgi:hypothetical protein
MGLMVFAAGPIRDSGMKCPWGNATALRVISAFQSSPLLLSFAVPSVRQLSAMNSRETLMACIFMCICTVTQKTALKLPFEGQEAYHAGVLVITPVRAFLTYSQKTVDRDHRTDIREIVDPARRWPEAVDQRDLTCEE